MNHDLLEKIQKLLSLSEKGVGGEKENAKKFLDKLMKKHGITFEDLDDTKKEMKWFKYNNDFEKQLIDQIIYCVVNTDNLDRYRSKLHKKCVGCEVTTEQFIDIELRFKIYSKKLEEGFKDFYHAFVIKNHIFAPSVKPKVATKEELEKTKKAMLLTLGIDKSQILKAIE